MMRIHSPASCTGRIVYIVDLSDINREDTGIISMFGTAVRGSADREPTQRLG